MVKIAFLGGARKVGASAVLIDTGEHRILLDYGSSPGKEPDFPLKINPEYIDVIILSHAHIDHSGAIPVLYKKAKRPILVTTPVTLELADLLINDMIKLNGPKLPFKRVHVQRMIESALLVNYEQKIELFDGIRVTLHNAGHIPGSASIELEIDGKKIWYTGDINTIDTRLLKRADIITDADIIIMESTYSYKNHPDRKKEERRLIERVKEIVESGGVALIPAFAVGRAQEVISVLYAYKFGYNTALDGMAQTATNIMLSYPEYLRDWHELKQSALKVKWMRKKSERKKMVRRPSAVVSPAGMLSGGWADWYIKQVYKNEKNAIFFVSYQVPGTPGYYALNERKIRINGKERKIKAQVDNFELSSHTDRNGLFNILREQEKSEHVFVVHGEEKYAISFAEELKELFDFNIYAPQVGEVYEV